MKVIDDCVHELQKSFRDGLEEKCRVGAINVSHQISSLFFLLNPLPTGCHSCVGDFRQFCRIYALGYLPC